MAGYKYRPDYKSLYPEEKMRPGEKLTDDILAVLRESDRKMEYQEYDIKTEHFRGSHREQTAVFLPSREDSLDRLLELDEQFFEDSGSVEDEAVENILIGQMMDCLKLLPERERELINALFFSRNGRGMSEREYSKLSGIPQKTINDRRHKILGKLKKLMEK